MFAKSAIKSPAVSEAPGSGGINGQLTVCFSILLVFKQYNISVWCKSAQSVAFYARRTTTIFGISSYVKLVTLYCHAIFWGTEGLGRGTCK